MDNKKSTKPKQVRRFVFVSILVLIISIVAFAFTAPGKDFFQTAGEKVGISLGKRDTSKEKEAVVDNKDNYTAQKDIAEGNTEKAVNAYQGKISRTGSDPQKATLLRELSNLLISSENPTKEQLEQGVKFAVEAYELDKSGESAAQASFAYRAIGNDTEADKYQSLASQKAKEKLSE